MMHKKTIWELNRIDANEFKMSEKTPLALVLDNVRSLINVGAMLRTADAFRLDSVWLCGVTGCPPSPEIHKTALGAEDSVEWRYTERTAEALETLRSRGFKICVLEQVEGSVSLEDFHAAPGEAYALVVGHEVDGVSQEAVDAADICIEIPQFGTKHSLNVSVSAGIALWQMVSNMLPGLTAE